MSRIVESILHEFDELNDDQKLLVVDNYRKIKEEELTTHIEANYLGNYFASRLVEEGFPRDMEILYNLTNNHGDGVIFSLNRVLNNNEILNILKKIIPSSKFDHYNQVFNLGVLEQCELEIKRTNIHYHALSFGVVTTDAFNSILESNSTTDKNKTFVITLVRQVKRLIKSKLVGLSGEFSSFGYNIIEGNTSFEEISDIFISENLEIEFTDKTMTEVKRIWEG